MLSLDPSTTNILITVAAVGLFMFFLILLMKLNPSTETKEDVETEIEVKRQEPLQTPHTAPQRPQAARIDSPRIAEKPLVAVSPTVTGSSIKMKQEPPTPDFSESRENPKQEKTVVLAKPESVSSRRDCLHHFGYLRTLSKNSPLPDECLGCERVVDCFVNKKPK